MHVSAVIGAQFGDEGKGLMVDALAHRGIRDGHVPPLVIRTNGGAQAGHTVVLPDGRRHVFSHFGSGALAGASTHLSQFMISNPIMFRKEYEALTALNASTRITVDPRGPITTPYDMMINQIAETSRGGSRHGSCGLGIGETIERHSNPELRLIVSGKEHVREQNKKTLMKIREEWVPARMSALGFETPPEFMAVLDSSDIFEKFLEDMDYLSARAFVEEDEFIRHRGNRRIIFEGAQGLLLDQDYGTMPHVTRSNTGLKNMLVVADEAGMGSIDVNYMTRCYTTRHGAGPLDFEGRLGNGVDINDPTNVPNDWQGAIRSAPLQPSVLRAAIETDLSLVTAYPQIDVTSKVVVTCCDQVTGEFWLAYNGNGYGPDGILFQRSLDRLLSDVEGWTKAMTSWGPTRDTLKGW